MTTRSTLRLENVSKAFVRAASVQGAEELTYALDGVSTEVFTGEFISIVGPSGCGKSTILRLIAGLIAPTTGRVTLNGKDVGEPSPNRAMVFQKPTLFPWLSVADNVSFSPRMLGRKKEKKDAVDRLIAMAGLSEFRDAYPHQLSGGMAQRVSLIRTMINDPEVFLLDEPLGALDAFTRMNMQDELISMWKHRQCMMILVTHDVDEAIYLSTKVIVMAPRPGRIVEEIPIELDYPRNRAGRRFLDYRTKVLKMLDFGRAEE